MGWFVLDTQDVISIKIDSLQGNALITTRNPFLVHTVLLLLLYSSVSASRRLPCSPFSQAPGTPSQDTLHLAHRVNVFVYHVSSLNLYAAPLSPELPNVETAFTQDPGEPLVHRSHSILRMLTGINTSQVHATQWCSFVKNETYTPWNLLI